MKVLAFLVALCPVCALAKGFYLDLGAGWLEDVVVTGERSLDYKGENVLQLRDKVQLSVESPFFMYNYGYTNHDWFIEYSNMGGIRGSDSIKSIRIYKRFWFK